jgi:hypothetical protein
MDVLSAHAQTGSIMNPATKSPRAGGWPMLAIPEITAPPAFPRGIKIHGKRKEFHAVFASMTFF